MGSGKTFHSILQEKMTKLGTFSEGKSGFSPLKTLKKTSVQPASLEELLLRKYEFSPQKPMISTRNIWLEQYRIEYTKYIEESATEVSGEMPQEPHIAREKRNWDQNQLIALSTLSQFGAIELNEYSTNEEIKSAFRRLAKQFHPDMIQGRSEQAIRESGTYFMQIHRSYKLLTEACGT